MAKKQDVFNAYYEGICLAVSCLTRAITDCALSDILRVVDHDELSTFLMSDEGEYYRQFFPLENGRIVFNK